jgi:energy-converting hydrogenase A subunit P
MADERSSIPGIHKLDSMADFLAKKPLELTAGLCCRARHRGSDCDKCQTVCAPGAVSFNDDSSAPVAVDFALCNGCGGCATACPNGVFAYVEGLTDSDLLKKIALTVSGSGAGEACFTCHRCEPATRAMAVDVLCLSRLHEGLLIGAAQFDAKKLMLISADCSSCEWGQSRFISSRLSSVRELSRSLGYKAEFYAADQKDEIGSVASAALIEKEQPTRRELMQGVAGFLKTTTASWVDGKMAALRLKPETTEADGFIYRLSAKRRMLLELIKETGSKKQIELPGLHFGDVVFDGESCNLCGDCALLCPTAAIAVEDHPDGTHLVFYPGYCVNCGVCELACRQGSLAFAGRVNLREVAAGRGRGLKFAATKYECISCKLEFAAAQPAAFCPTCHALRRRQGDEADAESFDPKPVVHKEGG